MNAFSQTCLQTSIFFFSMQVHIACNSDKQWILITANFIDSCFDVLNPDSCNEKFKNIINTVIHNFKIFFLNDYPRCPYFNINEFKTRYVEVPKHNFRLVSYSSVLFLQEICMRFTIWLILNIQLLYIIYYFFFTNRYDSGIFVIQFMLSYNGIVVKPFSNVSSFSKHFFVCIPTFFINMWNHNLIDLVHTFVNHYSFFCSQDDIQYLREKLLCQLVISRYNELQVPLVKKFLAEHVSIFVSFLLYLLLFLSIFWLKTLCCYFWCT